MKKFTLILFIIFNFLNIYTISYAFEHNLNKKEILLDDNKKQINKAELTADYILGPGDVLDISFGGLEFLNGKYPINPEGKIYLPELNLFSAEGKTVTEIIEELEFLYKEFIFNPDLEIFISTFRPISIYLSGEVKKPGLYQLSKGGKISDSGEESYILPRLYDALKLGEGFNNNANLSSIEIIRSNLISQGGGQIMTNIDLISLFKNGDQSKNIRIYDKDIINITSNEDVILDQILAVNRTNISPDFITVFITGNAVQPGAKNIRNGSSLIQALSLSGGKKLFTGNVEFIRFNGDGTTSKKEFKYNTKAKINTSNNPILMNGDLINVKRTLLGSSAEIISDVTGPILSWYGLFNLFD